MKFLIVVSCLLVAVYALPPEIVEQIKQHIMEVGKECKGEVAVSDDEIATMKSHQLPTTHEGKCFIACMHKKFGCQDKSGKIDKAASYAMIEKIKPLDGDLYGKMKQAADTCYAKLTDADDECETAYNMMECFITEHKNLGIKTLDFD